MMNDNSKASWHSFMWSADDFFITYALTCEFSVHSVIMFVLGHSIELYLKAVYTFQTNDIQKAIKFSHDIKGLFKACQKEDPKFMPDFTFKANAHIILICVLSINIFLQDSYRLCLI